jgi:hypothetical protein
MESISLYAEIIVIAVPWNDRISPFILIKVQTSGATHFHTDVIKAARDECSVDI